MLQTHVIDVWQCCNAFAKIYTCVYIVSSEMAPAFMHRNDRDASLGSSLPGINSAQVLV